MNLEMNNLFEIGQKYSLNFRITKEMIKRFSELTGDVSSLHVNEDFGRRSIYRTNVAHGMLTIAHLSLLEFFCEDSLRFSVSKISANFLKPVFVDEPLCLEAEFKEWQKEENQFSIEYCIKKAESDVLVATGFLALNYSSEDDKKRLKTEFNLEPPSNTRMLEVALQERDFKIDQIEKNQKSEFSFKISRDCADVLINSLLADGVGKKHSKRVINGIDANLLATLLFSTFAGMCIPGRYATIINFQVNFDKQIQWDKIYDFIGMVTFKSSVNSISESIMMKGSKDEKETVYARGKMSVQVNSPSVVMPSIDTLRQEALDLQLKNKVVLITGASRGIGETTAKLFALHGAKVAINYLKGKDEAERIVQEIMGSLDAKAIAVRADVSNFDQVNSMVKTICAEFGTIDILVNNAVGNAFETDFMALSWEEVQKDIDIIVKGAFNCCKAVLPYMVKNGKGKIINVSTIYADNPPARQFKYVVAKSGLVGLTRSLAVEFAPSNIQVNMVVPSIIETDLTAGINKMVLNSAIQNTPMKRLASPMDVARSIIFLASSLNSFTTGQKIMVTGGNAPFL